MEAEEYRRSKNYRFDYFSKLTPTGIAPDYKAIEKFTEDFCNHQTKSLKEENKELKGLFNAAKKYIDKSPCDPDIYPEQFKAWEEYQKLLNK